LRRRPRHAKRGSRPAGLRGARGGPGSFANNTIIRYFSSCLYHRLIV
jgi:hypothetical protein